MKTLIIITAIVLVLLILCISPVVISVSYINEKFDYSIKYIGIKIFPHKEKKNKKHKKKEKLTLTQTDEFSHNSEIKIKEMKSKNELNEVEKDMGNSEKKQPSKQKKTINDIIKAETFTEKIHQIVDFLKASHDGFRTVLRHISITDIFIDFNTADEDAYNCAMSYAKVNIALYNILGFMSHYIKVRKKSISTKVSFGETKSRYDISFKIRLGLGIGIIVILGIIIKFFRNTREREKLEEA